MSEGNRCFVIMPYGKKKDAEGNEIDFDLIYRDLIQEPIEHAGLAPVRCDEIEAAGSIRDGMFEHIIAADVAVVDITNLNANVFYELGARHALRDKVTILIRKRGGAVPFNIGDMRILEYPAENGSMRESRDAIQRFIEAGLSSGAIDSPIHPVLEAYRAKEVDERRRIEERRAFTYRLEAQPEKEIEIRTGDIRHWRGVDVWVNSENTNMQMARFYDRNLSAVIRYYGAEKDENDEIVKDTIALELTEAMRGRESVALGTVFTTGAGALAHTHGVKRIFHAAAVTGVPGAGYRAAVEIVDTCVNRCLRRMDSPALADAELRSIAFPMIGTGAGGGDVYEVAKILIDTAAGYLERKPESGVEKVIFMAWNLRDLGACTAALDQAASLEPVPAPAGS